MAHLVWLSVEVPSGNGQGGQRRQYHQIRELAARGHDITVVSPEGQPTDSDLRVLATVERPRLHVRGYPIPFRLRKLHRMVSDTHWDVVIVSHHGSSWLAPDRLSTPILLDMHNVMSDWYRRAGQSDAAKRAWEIERVALRRATGITTCSEVETHRLIDMHPEIRGKVFTSPLGVDSAEWPEQVFSRARPLVGLFGNWAWEPNRRGLEWFCREVWPRLIELFPDAEGQIAGTGVNSNKLPRGLTFVGRVEDLAAFAARATVIAVPVIHGVGASMKFPEALASGASVIATPDAATACASAGAFVGSDAAAWADWTSQRLMKRQNEPAPNPNRQYALSTLTWANATEPMHKWISAKARLEATHPT